MKRLLLSSAVAGLALAAAAPAAAAPFITIVTGSGTFGNNDVTCAGTAPCTFSDTINFTTPAGYSLVSLTLTSAMVGTDMATNIDFTTASFNGTNFTIGSTGATEFRYLLNQGVATGANNTLLIAGTSGGRAGYSGTLVFTATPSVPEPATWAMMIAGFGMVGFAMRRRQKVSTTVSYAG